MLLLGTVTTGFSYSHVLGVTNAVREGARFGATADATSGTTWADNVIARVRQTQFDDPNQDTDICVQLWKMGTGQVAGDCSAGNGSVTPALTLPTTATANPAVPDALSVTGGLQAGQCAVRVIAARNYNINFLLGRVARTSTSYSMARYERTDVYTTCS